MSYFDLITRYRAAADKHTRRIRDVISQATRRRGGDYFREARINREMITPAYEQVLSPPRGICLRKLSPLRLMILEAAVAMPPAISRRRDAYFAVFKRSSLADAIDDESRRRLR